MILTGTFVERAGWSGGDRFDTEDIAVCGTESALNPEVTPLNGAPQSIFGDGTTREIVNVFPFRMDCMRALPQPVLDDRAYDNVCPGPSRVREPVHPTCSENAFADVINAVLPGGMGVPVMTAWGPVEYRPDDIVVMRRDPDDRNVDEAGNQPPSLDEVHYRLSTWTDRDVQAVAGTGDVSSLEQPGNDVEPVRRPADEAAPARPASVPRTIGYTPYPNLSVNNGPCS